MIQIADAAGGQVFVNFGGQFFGEIIGRNDFDSQGGSPRNRLIRIEVFQPFAGNKRGVWNPDCVVRKLKFCFNKDFASKYFVLACTAIGLDFRFQNNFPS